MSGLTKPKHWVTPADMRLIWLASFVSAVLLLPHLFLTAEQIYAQPLLRAITFPVALLMTLLPLAMYWGIHLNQQVKFEEKAEATRRRRASQQTGKLLCRCRFQNNSEGTVWELTNANPFHWTQAQFFIERVAHEEKETEKLQLGNVTAGHTLLLHSQLEQRDGARWRILIVSHEGQLLDFPERWVESPFDKYSLN